MFVYLKDGQKFEIKNNSTVLDLAKELGIHKKSLAAEVNGILVDLSEQLSNDSKINIITYADAVGLAILRHSTSHVLAKAILELNKEAKLAIGPSIDNGFYYDIKCPKTYSIEDLSSIECKMKEIIDRDISFKKKVISKKDAIEYFSDIGQEYKVELCQSIEEDTVTTYELDGFIDLCRGPHIPSTKYIPTDAFKLTSVAGAYWRGDSNRDMLQRIYGTVFPSKKEMKCYFDLIEQAQARDHRKLGQELEIFHLDDVAPGNVFWLKNGAIIFGLIKDYLTKVIRKNDYFLVQTPQLMNRELWETSGHWEKFKENMFVVEDEDNSMAIKPMNCPGHIICYKSGPVKSYRDLPIRMAEFGLCHRNESSGSLHGIMRLRAFMQDDGHIFCTPEQIVSETLNVCSMLKEIYSTFGFKDIAVKFSDRPEKRVGSDEIWDLAEKSLTEAADAAGLVYTLNKGEGAFYGPKLEFVLKDCLGRDWQCGTLQVDFNLPERFGISYTESNGSKKTPVMLHRAIIGSLERFIGILIENYAGKFPFWLAPIQVAVASITDETKEYASEVNDLLKDCGFRTTLDTANEKITYKIRQHSTKKIPVIAIIGKREMEERTVSIRLLGSNTTTSISLSELQSFLESME